jgi:ribosome-binding protein aMBF1 (putative translation factor)
VNLIGPGGPGKTLPSRGSDAPRDGGSDFGTLLRALRLDRGLTQAELADRAGMSVRAVGSLERGHAIPRRDTAERL